MPCPRHLRLRLARHLRLSLSLAQVAADTIARSGRARGAATRTQPGARRAVRGGYGACQCEACQGEARRSVPLPALGCRRLARELAAAVGVVGRASSRQPPLLTRADVRRRR